ncbi:MAG: hypothetical protein R3C42_03015 [Parvularculaceae bacterium]
MSQQLPDRLCEPIVTGGDGAIDFEMAEYALDAVALTVEALVVSDRDLAVRFRRNCPSSSSGWRTYFSNERPSAAQVNTVISADEKCKNVLCWKKNCKPPTANRSALSRMFSNSLFGSSQTRFYRQAGLLPE